MKRGLANGPARSHLSGIERRDLMKLIFPLATLIGALAFLLIDLSSASLSYL
jgi:hypothetical protein